MVMGMPLLAVDLEKRMRRWLLVSRGSDDPDDLAFHQIYGPEGMPIEELVRVCQGRWVVEECFAEAKGEVGMDHYGVRRWEAWHRYVTLCLLAHALLVVTRLVASEEEDNVGKEGLGVSLIPPTVPEVRRLVLAIASPERRRRFLPGWST